MNDLNLTNPLGHHENGPALAILLGLMALVPVIAIAIYFPPYIQLIENTAFRAFAVLGLEIAFAILALGLIGGASTLINSVSRTNWMLLGMLIALAFSLAFFFPENAAPTILRTVFWMGHLVFGLTLCLVLKNLDPAQIFLLSAAPVMLMGLAYTALLGTYYVIAGPPTGKLCTIMTPGIGNIRSTGYFISAALGLLIAFSSLSNTRASVKAASFAGACLLGIFTFYTGTRGPLFAIAAAAMAFSLILPVRKSVTLWATFIAVLVISAVVTLIIPPAQCEAFNIVNRLAQTESASALGSGRMELILLTIELVKEYPLFGRGEFILWNLPDVDVTQSHNSPLQVMMTWGMVGSAIFWFLLIRLTLKLYLGARHAAPTAQVTVFAILLLLAYSLIDGTLYYSLPLTILTMLAAGAYAAIFYPAQSRH